MENYSLNLKFKGERTYIHSSEIYKEIEKIIVQKKYIINIKGFKLSIHKMTDKENILFLTTGVYDKNEKMTVNFSFEANNVLWRGFLLENDKKVSEKIPFEENKIFESLLVDSKNNSVSFSTITEFDLIDLIVAANKFLHLNVLEHLNGKWLCTKLEFTKMLKGIEYKNVQIIIIKNFKNVLTKSSIIIDNEKIGEIYFSRTE